MEVYSVFITGANRGIGYEFTKQLLALDVPPRHIFATYRNPQSIQALEILRDNHASTSTVHLIQMDVTVKSDIEIAYEKVKQVVQDKGLTLLINNSGIVTVGKFPNLTEEVLNNHFATNTTGPIMVAQIMYPLLKASAASRTDGSKMSFSRAAILNITSMVGSITRTGVEFLQDLRAPAYKISKAGLNMAMRIIASNVKDDNILVIMMCPGWVKTDMGTDNAEITPEESISAMLKTIATLDETHTGAYMDRNGTPYQF